MDGLSQIAEHPPETLKLLHGTLFEVRCQDDTCGHVEQNYRDPIVPSLAIPKGGQDPTTNDAMQGVDSRKLNELDVSDASVPISNIPLKDLPGCSRCKKSLLRPNVVWFGEQLPSTTLGEIDEYLETDEGVDLILVIGTSAKVYPAAGYIPQARMRGAKVCVVNMDAGDAPPGGWKEVSSIIRRYYLELKTLMTDRETISSRATLQPLCPNCSNLSLATSLYRRRSRPRICLGAVDKDYRRSSDGDD